MEEQAAIDAMRVQILSKVRRRAADAGNEQDDGSAHREQRSAAVKIQSMERGRQHRRKVERKDKAKVLGAEIRLNIRKRAVEQPVQQKLTAPTPPETPPQGERPKYSRPM